jgi:hypothetical protein
LQAPKYDSDAIMVALKTDDIEILSALAGAFLHLVESGCIAQYSATMTESASERRRSSIKLIYRRWLS